MVLVGSQHSHGGTPNSQPCRHARRANPGARHSTWTCRDRGVSTRSHGPQGRRRYAHHHAAIDISLGLGVSITPAAVVAAAERLTDRPTYRRPRHLPGGRRNQHGCHPKFLRGDLPDGNTVEQRGPITPTREGLDRGSGKRGIVGVKDLRVLGLWYSHFIDDEHDLGRVAGVTKSERHLRPKIRTSGMIQRLHALVHSAVAIDRSTREEGRISGRERTRGCSTRFRGARAGRNRYREARQQRKAQRLGVRHNCCSTRQPGTATDLDLLNQVHKIKILWMEDRSVNALGWIRRQFA